MFANTTGDRKRVLCCLYKHLSMVELFYAGNRLTGPFALNSTFYVCTQHNKTFTLSNFQTGVNLLMKRTNMSC